mmetsp:Transcript_62595/g.149051  ORF Transcript_62595/g.149051 Transcript_62595/m.149051 type:complete len:247 (+) Transcript_62595:1320-2060(+)
MAPPPRDRCCIRGAAAVRGRLDVARRLQQCGGGAAGAVGAQADVARRETLALPRRLHQGEPPARDRVPPPDRREERRRAGVQQRGARVDGGRRVVKGPLRNRAPPASRALHQVSMPGGVRTSDQESVRRAHSRRSLAAGAQPSARSPAPHPAPAGADAANAVRVAARALPPLQDDRKLRHADLRVGCALGGRRGRLPGRRVHRAVPAPVAPRVGLGELGGGALWGYLMRSPGPPRERGVRCPGRGQ